MTETGIVAVSPATTVMRVEILLITGGSRGDENEDRLVPSSTVTVHDDT